MCPTLLILYYIALVKATLILYAIAGGEIMKKRVTFTLDEYLIEALRDISDKTMIPQSRIVDAAIRERIESMLKASE